MFVYIRYVLECPNVYKASLVSMMAGFDFIKTSTGSDFIKTSTGSDFIKTSTGKESVNATFPVALVMVRAVRDYYQVCYICLFIFDMSLHAQMFLALESQKYTEMFNSMSLNTSMRRQCPVTSLLDS